MSSKQERELINALQKKRGLETKAENELDLFQKMLPALRAIMKAGGSADNIMKKSGPIAAYKLAELLFKSEKEEIILKAAEKIISYDLGKPVERSINVYGDLSRMNERDVDNQIMMLLNKEGASQFLETTLNLKKPKKRLQKRKPRNADALIIEATAQRSDASAETGTPPASEDQGTPS